MSLNVRHISYGANVTADYITKLRTGEIKSLKTSFSKLNKALLNGIDWNRIFTIAALSGGGKSTILEQIKRDFLDLNGDSFEILSFDFEMLIEDQLTRYVSSKIKKSLKDIYSSDKPLSDEDYKEVVDILEARKNAPVFYVDNPGTPEQIRATILQFAMERDLLSLNKGLVISIDHATLVKGKSGETEKTIIDELMTVFLELKKYFASTGLRCIFLVLSQLNRDIERPERTSNPLLHFPTRNDIFAASSIYHCSDYVMISHRPANVNGIKDYYGPPQGEKFPRGLPIKSPADPKRDMVYWHLIKERFGKTVIIPMVEDFKNATLEQINLV